MNTKVANRQEILDYYNQLYAELKEQSLHLYIAKMYYYKKIADKFGISESRTYSILSEQWRKREYDNY
ncbi:MAG: hypothetical protein R3Y26_09345 [Rikenellaceae bacterium]